MSALARELEEARKRAGDAEAEAYALRERLRAAEREALAARRVAQQADAESNSLRSRLADSDRVLAALDSVLENAEASDTGDLACDVAGLVATLREHEIALAHEAERGVLLGLEAAAARLREYAEDRADCKDAETVAASARARSLATEVSLMRGRAGSIARGAQPEPAPQPEALQLCTPEAPKAALAVGATVRVRLDDRAAVGRIGRSPTDGTLEAWRVEADDGREFYGREGDIERVAVEP